MIGIALMSGEQLWKPVEIKQRRGVELRAAEAIHVIVQTVAQQAEREAAMLDRPHRSAVIAVRVVRGVTTRERAYAPPAEQILLEEAVGRTRHVLLVHDAGGKAVAGIR